MTLPNSDSDKVSEEISEVVEVKILSTTNSDNHREKLCKVKWIRVYLILNMILSIVRLVSFMVC